MRDNRSKAEKSRVGLYKARRARQRGLESRARARAILEDHAVVMTVATLSRPYEHSEVRLAPPPVPRLDWRFGFIHRVPMKADTDETVEVAFKVLDDGGTGVTTLPRIPLYDAAATALTGYRVFSIRPDDAVVIDQRERSVFIVKAVPEEIFEEYRKDYSDAIEEMISAYADVDRSWFPKCDCSWCVGVDKPRHTVKQELAKDPWYPRED